MIGNGLRSSISNRREEIEILELVGATYTMIRRPYVIDGAFTGFLAGVLAICLSAVVHHLGVEALAGQIHLLALGSDIRFLSPMWIAFIISAATAADVIKTVIIGLQAVLTMYSISQAIA